MDEAACTKQRCVRAEVAVMGRAMMGKASLKAVRYSGLEIVGYGGIFVGGEGKLKNTVSDFAW